MAGHTTLSAVVLALVALFGAAPAEAVENGPIAYDGRGGIHVVNPDGSFDSLVARNGSVPAWSPDGRRIAYAGFERIRRGKLRCPRMASSFGRCYGLYVQNVYRGTRRRVAFGQLNSAPSWSPDGKKIAYARGHRVASTRGDLWMVDVRGGTPVRLTRSGHLDYPTNPDWSPDGTRIAFGWADAIFTPDPTGDEPSSHYEASHRVIPANGGAPTVTIAGGCEGWTPDGQFILCFNPCLSVDGSGFCSEFCAGSQPILYCLVNADGSAGTELELGLVGDSPVWAPRGDRLALVTNIQRGEIWTVNRDGSDPKRVPVTGAWPDWGSGPLLTHRLRPPRSERRRS